MKYEHQMGSLDSCLVEFQEQAYAERLELKDAHHGYIESQKSTSVTKISL